MGNLINVKHHNYSVRLCRHTRTSWSVEVRGRENFKVWFRTKKAAGSFYYPIKTGNL